MNYTANKSERIKEIEGFPFPALIINKEFFIEEYNIISKNYFSLRRGTSLRNLVSENEILKLQQLVRGRVVAVDVLNKCAFCYIKDDKIYMEFRLLSAFISKRLMHIIDLNAIITENITVHRKSATVEGWFFKVFNIQKFINKFLYLLNHGQAGECQTLNLMVIAGSIADIFNRELKRADAEIFIRGKSDIYAIISQEDITALFSGLFTLAYAFTDGKKIEFEADTTNYNFCISINFPCKKAAELISILKNGYQPVDGINCQYALELILMQLLCQFYGWNFEIIQQINGNLSFKIVGFLAENGEISFKNRDVVEYNIAEFVKRQITLFFGDCAL